MVKTQLISLKERVDWEKAGQLVGFLAESVRIISLYLVRKLFTYSGVSTLKSMTSCSMNLAVSLWLTK